MYCEEVGIAAGTTHKAKNQIRKGDIPKELGKLVKNAIERSLDITLVRV